MNIKRAQSELANARSRHVGQDGYSLLQLLVVLSIMIILTAAAVFSLTPQRRAYRTDDAAGQVTNFLRDAYQRALTQRQTMRVQVDRSAMLIKIIDENSLPGGDEVEVRREKLNPEVSVTQPTLSGSALNAPASPYNYPVAVFSSNLWEVRFRSDASVVDTAGNSISATLFVSMVNPKTTDTAFIRAVTLFGPSGSVRLWRYTGSSFDAGAN